MRKTIGIVAYNEKGKEVAYFTSRCATAQAGLDPTHVRKCIRGERNTHMGLSFEQLSSKVTRKLVEKYGTNAQVSPKQAARI